MAFLKEMYRIGSFFSRANAMLSVYNSPILETRPTP